MVISVLICTFGQVNPDDTSVGFWHSIEQYELSQFKFIPEHDCPVEPDPVHITRHESVAQFTFVLIQLCESVQVR